MFKHGFPPEWSTLKKLIWLVGTGIAGAASGIWKTITGTLIHITDALASPMQKCEVTLEPIQDLHGQDAPYPDGGGKNLLQVTAETTADGGITFTVNSDGSVSVAGQKSGGANFFIAQITLPEGNYKLNGGVSGDLYINVSGKVNSYGSDFSAFSVNSGGETLNVKIYIYSSEKVSETFYPMICLGTETDTTFSPYSNICPITGWTGCEVWVKDEYDTTLPATASVTFPNTVYGGSHEFVSGSGQSKMASVDLGTLTWTYQSSNTRFYTDELENLIKKPTVFSDAANAISSHYKIVSWGDFASANDAIAVATSGNMFIRDTRYTDAASLKTALSGVQFVYELDEPIEIQLTPQEISTLQGINNVWSNTNADTTIIYKAQAS